MNIDSLGPETVAEYFDRGLIKDVADLYLLKTTDLIGENGTKLKSAQKIINAIEKSKQQPFDRTLYALGIRFVGKVTAKNIAHRFLTLDNLINAVNNNQQQLLDTEGVGAVIASSIIHYFNEPKNIEIVNRLCQYGLNFKTEQQTTPQNDTLKNQNIVISGTFTHHSREEYKNIIEAHGGKNSSSISAKTSFILAGENMGPSKLEKAQKLSIKIINEEEFLDLIKNTNS